MPPEFDPYYKWLAIPPHEQPPNHYRLLAVPLFTDDPDVIENAADQRMAHIRSVQTGMYAEASQTILNQLAQARACLLNPVRKAEYDAALHANLRGAQAPEPPPMMQSICPEEDGGGSPSKSDPSPGSVTSLRSRSRPMRGKSWRMDFAKQAVISAAGLLLGYLCLCWLAPRYDYLGLIARETPIRRAVEEELVRVPSQSAKPATPPPPNTEEGNFKSFVPSPDSTDLELSITSPNERSHERREEDPSRKLKADRDSAIEKGDIQAALTLTEKVAKLDGTDVLDAKVWVIDELRRVNDTLADSVPLTESLLELASQALQERRGAIAKRSATAALLLARRSGNKELALKATRLILEVESME